MRILCIDDDNTFLEKIKKMILDYSMKEDLEIKLDTINYIPDKIYENIDALFVDIVLKNKTIFDYLNTIREINHDLPIIFFSNYDSFVFKSVKYNVFDYIRKKNIDEEFNDMMNRLTSFLFVKKSSLLLKKDGYYKEVSINEVVYIESFSHNTFIYTEQEIFEIKKDTKDILGINIKYFYKIHRSYYINFKYLKSFNKDNVILKNNIIIPIGKTYKPNIIKDYLNYLNKKI